MHTTVKRGGRFLAAVLLCLWTLAVLAGGADMLTVWIGQLQGAGEPGAIYVAIWQRLALLAIIAITPPCLVWAIWRAFAWMAHAAQLRSH